MNYRYVNWLASLLVLGISFVTLLSSASARMLPSGRYPMVCFAAEVCQTDRQNCLMLTIPYPTIQLNETAAGHNMQYVMDGAAGRPAPFRIFPSVKDVTAYLEKSPQDINFEIALVPSSAVSDSFAYELYVLYERAGKLFPSETYTVIACKGT